MCYENRHVIVDNCAMGGRSSKTFREEGRLDDIRKHIKSGDYLVIQFGHNDASASKPERYVPVEEFENSLMEYVDTAKKAGATAVLVSSITLRPCSETMGNGEALSASEDVYKRQVFGGGDIGTASL